MGSVSILQPCSMPLGNERQGVSEARALEPGGVTVSAGSLHWGTTALGQKLRFSLSVAKAMP